MLHPNKSAPADVSLREDAPISPSPARARRCATTAAILRAAMEETGTSVRDLAAAIGDSSTSRVEAWREGVKTLGLDAMASFPVALLERVTVRLLDARRDRTADRRAVLPLQTHCNRAAVAAGDFVRVIVEAQADGRIDDRERVSIRKCARALAGVGDHASLDLDRAAGMGR
jgi:tellurite resistance protein